MSEGKKTDFGKPGVGLIDTEALIQLARVLDFGKNKYAAHNWRKGIEWQRIIDSLLRHTLAFNNGENNDDESGLPHIAHAMCNCMFLLNYAINHPELDNRYKKEIPPVEGEIKLPKEKFVHWTTSGLGQIPCGEDYRSDSSGHY